MKPTPEKIARQLRSAYRYGNVTKTLLKQAAEVIDEQRRILEAINKLSATNAERENIHGCLADHGRIASRSVEASRSSVPPERDSAGVETVYQGPLPLPDENAASADLDCGREADRGVCPAVLG